MSGGTLYAGGHFSRVVNSPATYSSASHIAQWNGSSWSALGVGITADVYALAVSGGTLYAGGAFKGAGNNLVNYIAQWDGNNWSALGSGVGLLDEYVTPCVNALAVSGNLLYAGGYFYTAGGKPCDSVAGVALQPPTLSVSPVTLTPSCTLGQNAAAQSFQVWNSGMGTLSYAISTGAAWLSCTPASGTSSGELDSIAVDYNTAGLAAGTYNGTITVTGTGACGSPQTVGVTLTVVPAPQLAVSPITLTNSCAPGQNAGAQSFDVWNSGGGTLSYTVSGGPSWLSYAPTSGSSSGAHSMITLTYNTAGLAAGTYTGTITVTAAGVSGSPRTVNVTLMVVPPPQLAVSVTNLPLSCAAGNNVQAYFDVWNSGGGSLSYTISASPAWLSCTPASGTSSGEHHTIMANCATASLLAGTYYGNITVTAAGVSGSPQTINVKLGVQSGIIMFVAVNSSHKFAASWAGGPGIWLEQSSKVKGGTWAPVPGSAGLSYIEVPLTNSPSFFRVAQTAQAPVITAQPVSLAVTQGTLASFSVTVTGVPPPSCQWRFNGQDLAGPYSSTLSITNAQPSNAGDYTVVAFVSSLAVTSSPATLVLLPPDGHLTWIPAGTFVMGSPTNEVDRSADEGPQTTVTLTQGFWIGTYAVTQLEYTNLMGANPSYFTDSLDEPVEFMPWTDATNYCYTLTQREQAAGRIPANYQYRLPTEAESEYACRAGTTTRFSYGDDPGYSNLTYYAWYTNNSGMTTHPVGQKLPNPWGLYDMHGNVWEWCQDWFATYPGGSVTNPVVNPPTGSNPIVRGGSYYFPGANLRSAQRGAMSPLTGYRYDVGLREVLGRIGP